MMARSPPSALRSPGKAGISGMRMITRNFFPLRLLGWMCRTAVASAASNSQRGGGGEGKERPWTHAADKILATSAFPIMFSTGPFPSSVLVIKNWFSM